MKKIISLSILMVILVSSYTFASWQTFVIRNANGGGASPIIQANGGGTEFIISAAGMKAAWGTSELNGKKLKSISRIAVSRLDDVTRFTANSGPAVAPYINIWITDGLGNFAVIANEPSNPEWTAAPAAFNGGYDISWNYLKTKTVKVYENTDKSWLPNNGVGLTFNDLADFLILSPTQEQLSTGWAGLGTGAPRELGTNIAYGFNWILGDTQSNYQSGDVGYILANPMAVAYPVHNITKDLYYSAIQPAINAASNSDEIHVASGTYTETLIINKNGLKVIGAGSATTNLNTSNASSYGVNINADDVTLSGFNIIPPSSLAAPTKNGYTLHASKSPNIINGITLNDLKVDARGIETIQRTGIDLHGVDNPNLNNIAVYGCDYGVGVALTGCVGGTYTNITTSDNAWGGIAVYVSRSIYCNRASSNINIDFSQNSIGEFIYSEDEYGLYNTNINIGNWTYTLDNVYGTLKSTPDNARMLAFTNKPLNDALLLGAGFNIKYANTLSYCWNPSFDYFVGPGMQIRRAIEMGTPLTLPDLTLTSSTSNSLNVYVSNGVYLEGNPQLIINKDVNIIGENKELTIIKPALNTTNSGDARGFILVQTGNTFNMSNVKIDGEGKLVSIAILSKGMGVIDNCIFQNIAMSESGQPYAGRGIAVYDNNMNITGNAFSNIGRIGIFLYGSGVTDALVSGNTYVGKGNGDFLDYGIELSGGAKANINNNTISNCIGVATVDGSGSAGIMATTYWGNGTEGTITNNTINNCDVGIYLGYYSKTNPDNTVAYIHNNIMNNCEHSIFSVSSVRIDATCNWHGSAIPAEVVSKISGDVDFTPYLTTTTGPCDGYLPVLLTRSGITIDEFTAIQPAIDAAIDGDVIIVADGNYNEQLTISKSIILSGNNKNNTIISAPSTIPAASNAASNIITVSGAGVNAEIRLFTIMGPGPSSCGSIGRGIFVRDGAYAYIHDNNIIDIRDNSNGTISGCQNGIAIQVGRQALSTTGTASIENNTISAYQKGGIVVDNIGSNADIRNNVITGIGTTPIIAQNGIQISRGAVAHLYGNTVTGNSFHLDGSNWDWGSAGILLYQNGAVELQGGNNLSANDINCYISLPGPVTLGAENFGPSSNHNQGWGYIYNYSDLDIDARLVRFNGKTGAEMSLAELYITESKILHKYDYTSLGLVTIKDAVDDNCISLKGENYTSPIWNDDNAANTDATLPATETAPVSNFDFYDNYSLTFENGILSVPYNNTVGRVNYNSDKLLYAFFETGSNITSRQVVFEAGGVRSGFNVYVYNNRLYMGIWNQTQRRYFYQACSTNTKYLVSIERSGTSVRVSVNGVPAVTIAAFSNFTAEAANTINGIGGSYNGTRYMDNVSSTSTITHRFTGKIAEILCYNSCNALLKEEVLNYIDAKYGTDFAPEPTGPLTATKSTMYAEIDVYTWDEGQEETTIENGLNVVKESSILNVSYSTSESTEGKINLFDVTGSIVKSIYNGTLNKGTNYYTVSTDELSSGVFYLVAETNSGVETKQVVIVK